MGLEQVALALIGQTQTYDTKLKHWLKHIQNDKTYKQDFKEWQVDVGQSKNRQRIDAALYQLASNVIWYRLADGTYVSEEQMTRAITTFHQKIAEAQKTRAKFFHMKSHGWFKKKR